jgi:hypothetical protein
MDRRYAGLPSLRPIAAAVHHRTPPLNEVIGPPVGVGALEAPGKREQEMIQTLFGCLSLLVLYGSLYFNSLLFNNATVHVVITVLIAFLWVRYGHLGASAPSKR